MVPTRLLRQMTGTVPAWVTALAIASTASAGAATLLPFAVGRSIDITLSAVAGRATTAHMWTWVAYCAALTVIDACGDAFVQLGTGTTTGYCTGWLRRGLLRHILACGPKVTTRFAAGDAVSRLIGGTVDAGGAPSGAVLALTAAIPTFGSVIALGLIDPWLVVAFLAGMPIVLLVLRSFLRDTSDVVRRYQEAQGTITARLVETLSGARTIAAAGTGEREIARVLRPLSQLRDEGFRMWRVQGRVAGQSGLLVPALQVLVVAVAGFELTRHHISPGDLLAAGQYAALGAGIGATTGQLNRLARGRSGAARVAEMLEVPPPEQGTARLPEGRGRVEFRGVTVRTGDTTVIDDLNLVIPAGANVAVVGASGAGKSTIAALAGRLADPSDGVVFLDGVPLRWLDRRELRTAVSYAFDRPALLGRTVGDMIGFGVRKSAGERVVTAARAARADQFIRRLPRRYHTLLSRAPLSGGEVQRLGLARALAHAADARVLVLDDATSSLDTVTEMQVSRALTELHGAHTMIVVTHRAATAASADMVAWMEAGRLRACAPHAELWRDPDYRAVFGIRAPERPPERAEARQ
ncbi:MAG: ABC transporter ATP-binding protein [Nocardiopsaceae bacterium]|nr:ABC transporter ATP-binding protein [Nocardiopsaceae bacterium]